MPVTNWNPVTIDGHQYLAISLTQLLVPLEWDPNSGMFIAVAAPSGGLANIPALVQGDPGFSPTFDTPTLHPLVYSDATADSVTFTLVTPATPTAGPVYHADFWLHTGAPGAAAAHAILGSTDLAGTPAAGQIIVVNPAATGFVYQSQKVGDRYLPGALNSTPSGNAAYTLGQISVPAQNFDWRPRVGGQCVVTGTGSNVVVDLVARLQIGSTSAETSGNIIGRAMGSGEYSSTSHVHPTLALIAGAPAGSSDSYDKIPAGSAATIYLRAERQASGTDTFTTSATRTSFWVKVDPVP